MLSFGSRRALLIASRATRYGITSCAARTFSSSAPPSIVPLPPLSIIRIQSTVTSSITIETLMNADTATVTTGGGSAWRMSQYEQPNATLSTLSDGSKAIGTTTGTSTVAAARTVIELQESPMSGGEGGLHLLIPDRWISLDILAQAPDSKIKVSKVTEADLNVKCSHAGLVEIGSIRAITASIDTGRQGGLKGGELSGTDVNVSSGSQGIQLRRLVALRGSVLVSGKSSVTSIGSCFGESVNVAVEGPMRIGNMSCSATSPSSLLSSVHGPIVVEGLEGNARVQVESDSLVSVHLQGKCGHIDLMCGSNEKKGTAEIAIGPEALPIHFSVDSACMIVNEGNEKWGEEIHHRIKGRTINQVMFDKGAGGGGADEGRGRRGPGGGGDVNPYRQQPGEVGQVEVSGARHLKIKRMSWMEALKKKMALKAQEKENEGGEHGGEVKRG